MTTVTVHFPAAAPPVQVLIRSFLPKQKLLRSVKDEPSLRLPRSLVIAGSEGNALYSDSSDSREDLQNGDSET